MPRIDVSDLLSDPDLAEPLEVYRQLENVGANGRGAVTRLRVTPDPWGSVQPKDTAIGGNTMEVASDGSYRAAVLTVHTAFRLRSISEDRNGQAWRPDILVFNGDDYQVELVNDFTHYGGGFVQAELSSLPIQDNPPSNDVQPPAPFEALSAYLPGTLVADGQPVLVIDFPPATSLTLTVAQALSETVSILGQTLPLMVKPQGQAAVQFGALTWAPGQAEVYVTFAPVHFTDTTQLIIPAVVNPDPGISNIALSFG